MNESPATDETEPSVSGEQEDSSTKTFSTGASSVVSSLSRRQLLRTGVAGTALSSLILPASGRRVDDGSSAVETAPTQSGSWSQQYTIEKPEDNSGTYPTDSIEEFGSGAVMSEDGDTAVIVAVGRTGINDEGPPGSVFVYTRDSELPETWNRRARLTRDNTNDGFGSSISVSGTDEKTLVIGTPFECIPDEDDEDCLIAGAAHVYTGSGGSWSHQGRLVADDAEFDHRFGAAVAVSADGSTILIGAFEDEPEPDAATSHGSVYAFGRENGTWTQQAKLPGPEEEFSVENSFGSSLAVSNDGDTVVIGDGSNDERDGEVTGAAHIYTRTGGTWGRQATLRAADGDEYDGFSAEATISGDGMTAVITAPQDNDPNGELAGSAYVFTQDGGSWNQQAKLVAGDGDEDDRFGSAAALTDAGDTAIIGADSDEDPNGESAGSAYVYNRDENGWSQQTKLAPSNDDRFASFGSSIGLSPEGETAVIGAPNIGLASNEKAIVFSSAEDTTESEESMSVSLSPSSIPVDTETEVTATVTDESDSPVSGATVEIQDLLQEGTTDAEGTVVFSVTASEAGEYLVLATADGFEDADATLTATDGGQQATQQGGGQDGQDDESTDGSGPGFGVGTGVVSLGAVSYALRKRLNKSSSEQTPSGEGDGDL